MPDLAQTRTRKKYQKVSNEKRILLIDQLLKRVLV